MSEHPGRYEMTEALDFMSEYPKIVRIFEVLQGMAAELGDEAEMLRTVEHWLEWRRGT